jgi:hypothetical protein
MMMLKGMVVMINLLSIVFLLLIEFLFYVVKWGLFFDVFFFFGVSDDLNLVIESFLCDFESYCYFFLVLEMADGFRVLRDIILFYRWFAF